MDEGGATSADVVIAEEIASAEFAVTCNLAPNDTVRAYVEAGITPATRRAYKADLEHFRAWGGDIPTTDIQLAAYLAEQATTLKVATLIRRWRRSLSLTRPSAPRLASNCTRGVRRAPGCITAVPAVLAHQARVAADGRRRGSRGGEVRGHCSGAPALRRPSRTGSSSARYVGSSLIAVQEARARQMAKVGLSAKPA